MTETYESKRLRMQKALESLPADLRNRISLRNAEAAAVLSPEAHATLANALDNGLLKVARAIELLGQDPRAAHGRAVCDTHGGTHFLQRVTSITLASFDARVSRV